MKKQLIKISVHQSSKVLAILYFVITAIVCIPMGFFGIFSGRGEGAIFFFLIPFFYLIGTYIITAIGAWIYNIIASYFGGVEVAVKDITKES